MQDLRTLMPHSKAGRVRHHPRLMFTE